jgi:hypothetical protein
MNKSIITREGWHITRDGFRYYVEGGRIIYGIATLYDGTEVKVFPFKVQKDRGLIIGYDRVEPLARYYNLTRYDWRQ